ncbi:hypothetical protein FDI59_gp093 [Mycobacterium phage Yoshi]|nr:hypothetical protein FDI59_gp093 [Mycobacterium phage Yoshi]YP_009963682.1 hypothetical protein I5I01_gp81 [Mycobacterium phage MooMoo]AEK07841.1 hypothetical protein YOSHI_93 [Mycobacterium phage Yoshi]AVO21686.1 hypothetical protein SEA_MOOMOO_81 [Mycobacterium phage MooMoo]
MTHHYPTESPNDFPLGTTFVRFGVGVPVAVLCRMTGAQLCKEIGWKILPPRVGRHRKEGAV